MPPLLFVAICFGDTWPTKRIRRGSFTSVEELIKAIDQYIDEHNRNAKPFLWTAEADKIIEKVGRARLALDKVRSS